MSNIADLFVTVGADISDLQKDLQEVQKEFSAMGKDIQNSTKGVNQSMSGITAASQQMKKEMAAAYAEMRAKVQPFVDEQKKIQLQYYELSKTMGTFKGTTAEFMAEVEKLGKAHKAASDNIMKNNDMAKMSFIQTVGTMMAMSGQADKISKNYARMANPLYSINQAGLKAAEGLNNLAKAGDASVLALKMLGPNANMKELNDMVMMINRGLMRMGAVALVAAAASYALYGGLHQANMAMNPEYAAAYTNMINKLKEAFRPMVELFGQIMTPLFNFVAKIAELAIKFNEAHPILAKIIQGFIMLIPLLMLILSPLAIGIGLWNGMLAAFNALWLLIEPLITGLAAMMGTVLLVAAVLVAAGVAIWALWTYSETFRNGVIAAWEAIKQAAITAWNYILNSVLIPIWTAIVSMAMEIWGQLKDFWQEHGDNIMKIAEAVWSFVKNNIITQVTAIVATLTVLWNIVSSVIEACWSNIKGIISGAIDIILGVIGLFVSILTGDWKGAWDSIRQIVEGAWKMISNAITIGTNIVLGLIRGLGKSIGGEFGKIAESFYQAGKGFMDMLVKGINSAVGAVGDTIEKVAGMIRDHLPFSPAKEGPLSDLDKLDFGGPISDSISKGIPGIQKAMNGLMALPSIEANTQFQAENKEASILNFERMFDGANINVNEKEDIHSLMREFYRFATSKGRGLGVN